MKIISDIKKYLSDKYNVNISSLSIQPDICPPNMSGDLTINCFRVAAILKANPITLASELNSFLSTHADVQNVSTVKAFVNFELKSSSVFRDTLANIDQLMNETKVKNPKHYLVEYSAPNTNKPMHLGHIRNNTIGMSLVSLLRRTGNKVSAVNLINDRGIHICKSMLAYKKFGNDITPEEIGKKGDHLVGDFYVKFDQELKKELSNLRSQHPDLSLKTDEELFPMTQIGSEAQEMLRKWEANDPEVLSLWKKMNEWVIAGFTKTYDRMGIKFDKIYLESETYKLGKDVVLKARNEGLLKTREDGAIYADLKSLGLTEKILLRADSTSVYMTQDIGTTLKKYNDFKPDNQIWVVGDEQIHHFKTLFAILKLLGNNWADNLYHLAYGMINLPTGKMKSREGTVVDADNLFDDMHNLAKNATLERCEGKAPDDIEERSEKIAMGSLKFMLLKFNPKTTITFDPQAAIKFEGDTGPYVQYVCARINSILKKYKEKTGEFFCSKDINWNLASTKQEKDLAILSSFYPSIQIEASEKLDCSILVNYLLNLAKAFNSFYRECPVLSAENQDIIKVRLAICQAVRDILTDGLETLTISVPEAM